MYIDASEIDRGKVVEADVCIIGGGAVGIPMAQELGQAGLEVVLLESGAQDFDQATQDLYVGVESGTLLGPDTEYLTETRNRYYGGTTNTWNGWCRPLDPEDLVVRDWVDESGWPITQEEMQTFHRRAARVVQITPFDEAEGATPTEILPIGPEAQIENSFLHCSAPTRFAARFKCFSTAMPSRSRPTKTPRRSKGLPWHRWPATVFVSAPVPMSWPPVVSRTLASCWPPIGYRKRDWATVTISLAATSWITPCYGSGF
jgi:choline dehydrogenase-like flavoprotein